MGFCKKWRSKFLDYFVTCTHHNNFYCILLYELCETEGCYVTWINVPNMTFCVSVCVMKY
jgi:hypothetical protein